MKEKNKLNKKDEAPILFPKDEQSGALREDYVIKTLKAKFFSLIKQEKLGKTPEITKELDYLVEAIRELEAENVQEDIR